MKFIIIGLGNFGSKIATILTEMGHEVIGVDKSLDKAEALKEKISHTIALDSTDPIAVTNLPIKDTDIVMICIGEDEGANIMATALMKQQRPKRLISRAVNPLHETILESMGIQEIVHPEEETAVRWSKKLVLKGVIESFQLTEEYNIVEVKVPSRYIGKTIGETNIRDKFKLLVLATIQRTEEENDFGQLHLAQQIKGVASAQTMLHEDDLLVLYGHIYDIRKLLKER